MAKQDQFFSSPRALTTTAATENAGEVVKAVNALGGSTNSVIIDFNRWDKLFPYALILAEITEDFSGTRKYTEISRFILPIPPDQLNIQSPYAIQTSKTLGGVIEEHNGIPFKLIFATGTTGVYPLRSNVVDNHAPFGLFGGTISAVQQTVNAVANFMGSSSPSQFLASDADSDLIGTGYGQFRLLKVFLESYVNGKKNGERDMRLIFATFKDETAYVVTPVAFNVRREAGQALKYRYELQLRSFAEVPSSVFTSMGESAIEVSEFQTDYTKLLSKITNAQTVITSAVSVVNAFRADVQAILNVSRQSALFLKLAVNSVVSVLDLPNKLLADCKASVIRDWNTIRDSIQGQDGLLARLGQNTTNTTNAIVKSPIPNPRVAGQTRKNDTSVPPSVLDAIFSNPSSADAQAFLSQIKLDKLSLPKALRAQIDTEMNRAKSFTADDFERMRAQTLANMISMADTVGASDATFDSTYQNVHATTTRTPNIEDFNVLFAINDLLSALNELAANTPRTPSLGSVDYIAGAASRSGIAFTTPVSKFAVPFPYDYTLEELAKQYLGDPDRWLEIATLNGLREPYVDEVGFTRYLTANGKLSTVFISDAENLRVGQPVWIQSDFVAREKRHILDINIVAPGNIIITLDGEANLDRYQASAHAYLQAFLPDTVNSQQLIYIPSQTVVPDNSRLAEIPGVDAFDDLLELGGVDLLLTSSNDLAITPDGDCKLAYGLNALVQRARVALGTPQGSLIRHPTYGLPIKVGMSVADLDIKQLKSAVTQLFSDDPAFSGVINASIKQQAGVVQIGVGLQVAGQNLPISLTIQVKR